MAKIKLSALMTGISGKLGGQVFARNRGGAYVRNNATPLNPQTTSQTGVRALFGQISQAWSGLTEEQRETFNAQVANYAQTDVFGDLRNPSGKALFQRLNQNLAISDQTQIEVCGVPQPVNTPIVSNLTFELDGAGGIDAAQVDYSGTQASEKVIVYATPPVSAGTKFVKNAYRKLAVSAGGSTSVDITSAYEARFGVPNEGEKIFVKMKAVNANGQASTESSVFGITETV